ncbi:MULTISPECIES: DinB family protein [Brevibacterium]|uniref:DinB superfamily protein n=2 Tax=Brevibacterium TaxID=1696 RepID=A0A2H1L7P2_9MICO|nr:MULTISPECIES: DinB family protein [Brevibacterium]TWC03491.1 DinB family protein [Brevibacterium jeotgali]SLM92553.1 hypothetical protein FM105_03205 [Brevibacterium yomogidense]SMY12921.1 DinB superfamily protein [Brevibacterium jeotgali]
MTEHAPPPAETDTRDWTFVIDEGCEQCGYAPHDPATTAQRLLALPSRWNAVLRRDDAAVRPRDGVWSPLEYAGHSRDLAIALGERITAMLDAQNPTFADYDGEAEAVRGEFWAADPAQVAREIEQGTGASAAVFDRVTDGDWDRTGQRSDGFTFTVATLSRYLVHDLEHHLHDVDG